MQYKNLVFWVLIFPSISSQGVFGLTNVGKIKLFQKGREKLKYNSKLCILLP